MSYAYNNQDSQKKALIGTMMGLVKELQDLAPHPDKPDYNGPLFITADFQMTIANDHDSMIGTLMLESFLGAAFADAVSDSLGSWTQDFDAMTALECYSEYITDIEGGTKKAAAHGQGTLARLAGQSISKGFNMRSDMDASMQAFMNDMPKRMKIETALQNCVETLNNLDNAPQYNAAAPSFAA